MPAKTRTRPLRQIRNDRGLSRRQVAADLGISERTVIRHEDGTTQLAVLHRRAYADYYGISPEEIG